MIYVKDLSRMTAFYGQTLGLKRVDDGRYDSWVEFDAGGARVALHAIPAEIARHISISSPATPREKDPVKLFFEVKDVEGERARLASLGVAMVRRPWGSWDGIDPEGNVFGIVDPTSE